MAASRVDKFPLGCAGKWLWPGYLYEDKPRNERINLAGIKTPWEKRVKRLEG